MNDAMMALLIASRLGEHALETSAASPDALLPSLFGQIPGIERLNRTASDAARLLAEAETHLAYMAIPYALTIHHSFLVSVAQMVRDDGRDPIDADHEIRRQDDLAKLSLEIGHEYVYERCDEQPRGTLLPLFHLARRVRNRIVHFRGTAGSRLIGEYKALPEDAQASWARLARRPLPTAVKSGRLELLEGELVAVLTISRHLAQDVNDLLARRLTREYWAGVAVRDYRQSYPQRFGERARQLRRIQGHAARTYGALQLTNDELRAAMIGEGGSSY